MQPASLHTTPKPKKHKWRRRIIILLSVVVGLFILVISFASPITRYLIQKYDVTYTGREITLDWAYVNPLTGYVYLDNVKIYEKNSKRIFFEADGIGVNVSVAKIMRGTYEFSSLTLHSPKGRVIQDGKKFNFDDIIEKFTAEEKPKKKKEPVHLSILDMEIKNGTFYYQEKRTPVYYFIKNVHVKSPGLRWDVDSITTTFSFEAGIGTGRVNGNTMINLKNKDYRAYVNVRKFSLNIIEQYFRDMSNYGTFSATLDANMKSKGNFNSPTAGTTKGMLAISDFKVGKTRNDDYAAFKKLVIDIKEVSPDKHIYIYDSVILYKPYARFEKYDSLDNFQVMFGKGGSNIAEANANKQQQFNLIIEIAEYVGEIAKNFFTSNYKLHKLAIYDGDFRFNDYSTSEKFSTALTPFTIVADSIDKSRNNVNVHLKTGISPYGTMNVDLAMQPQSKESFAITYKMQNIPLSMFNPYTVTYSEYPLDRGTMNFYGLWNIGGNTIQSSNHLIIVDPRTGSRVKNKDTRWIPVPLIMSLVRDRGNVIDYEIPITGDLKDPDFHWIDPVLDLLENIFFKPPTIPYRMHVRSLESKIEKSLRLKWKLRQWEPERQQRKSIEKLAKFLKNNPEVKVVVRPLFYTEKEKEHILFYLAKKKFYTMVHGKNKLSYSESDSIRVEKMSVKDVAFENYLDKNFENNMAFTIQEKCAKYITPTQVLREYNRLIKLRQQVFMEYFREREVEKQVAISGVETVVPYNGFSIYKIDYKGDFPEDVREAWDKMNELNEKPPREKFRDRSRRKKRNG